MISAYKNLLRLSNLLQYKTLFTIGFFLLATSLSLVLLRGETNRSQRVEPFQKEKSNLPKKWPFEPLAYKGLDTSEETNDSVLTIRETVEEGDSLSRIFNRHGVSQNDLANLLASNKKSKRLKYLNPHQRITLKVQNGRLIQLQIQLTSLNSIFFSLSENGEYALLEETLTPQIKLTAVRATINRSLYLDGKAIGLSDKTLLQLTSIFAWDIDFSLDIRVGDTFSVIYEVLHHEGEMLKEGRILAAEFRNRGQTIKAILNIDDVSHESYFSDNGKAMHKAFLRNPVHFSRISSKFNLNRKHPVLNKIRAHKGVDYSAPTGTKIRATADGKISFLGPKGGYGNTIEIQHGGKYSTLYAHLSKFTRKLKIGTIVKQGEVIGEVGQSGLATGPHLHYEFRINGQHINPLTVELPQAQPMALKYIEKFKNQSNLLGSMLASMAKSPVIKTSDKLQPTQHKEILNLYKSK
jgi:murein DD-endopeptidase MepM/ murein hydrolase activator NlpD